MILKVGITYLNKTRTAHFTPEFVMKSGSVAGVLDLGDDFRRDAVYEPHEFHVWEPIPTTSDIKNPLVKKFYEYVDNHPCHTRKSVSQGAGYSEVFLSQKLTRSPTNSFTLQQFIDVVQYVGGRITINFP